MYAKIHIAPLEIASEPEPEYFVRADRVQADKATVAGDPSL